MVGWVEGGRGATGPLNADLRFPLIVGLIFKSRDIQVRVLSEKTAADVLGGPLSFWGKQRQIVWAQAVLLLSQ